MQLITDVYIPVLANRENPFASLLLAESLNGLPPTLIVSAQLDTLHSDALAMAARLKKSGVSLVHLAVAGVDHGFTHLDPREPAMHAWSAMAGALKRSHAGQASSAPDQVPSFMFD